jgi:hypothetical protein
MRHLPESGFGLHVYDLFLQAAIARSSHGGVRRLHLYLWHDRPPGIILQLSIVAVNREPPNTLVGLCVALHWGAKTLANIRDMSD